jgi:aminopeptidase C
LDLSSFWKKNCTQLPLLASLVRKYLIIPASSVSSESSFSVANFIQRKERSALSSKSFKQAIILRSAAQNEIF